MCRMGHLHQIGVCWSSNIPIEPTQGWKLHHPWPTRWFGERLLKKRGTVDGWKRSGGNAPVERKVVEIPLLTGASYMSGGCVGFLKHQQYFKWWNENHIWWFLEVILVISKETLRVRYSSSRIDIKKRGNARTSVYQSNFEANTNLKKGHTSHGKSPKPQFVLPLRILTCPPDKGPFQKEAGLSSNHHFWGGSCYSIIYHPGCSLLIGGVFEEWLIKWDPQFLMFGGDIVIFKEIFNNPRWVKIVWGVILKGMKECKCCWSFFLWFDFPRECIVWVRNVAPHGHVIVLGFFLWESGLVA